MNGTANENIQREPMFKILNRSKIKNFRFPVCCRSCGAQVENFPNFLWRRKICARCYVITSATLAQFMEIE